MARFITRFGDYQSKNPTLEETIRWLRREEEELELQAEIQEELIRFLSLTPRQQGWIFQARAYDYLLSRDADPEDQERKLTVYERVMFRLRLWAYDGLSRWVLHRLGSGSWEAVRKFWWWLLQLSRLGLVGTQLGLIAAAGRTDEIPRH
jgi:hypothetical protein